MRQTNGQLTFSPTDLTAFVACPHLTRLELEVARGQRPKPFRVNRHADLIRKKGDEHEAAFLEGLRAGGAEIVEIERPQDGKWDLERMTRDTEAAMRAGADVVFQAVLHDGQWRGFADFLVRVPTASELGPWSYEVLDTKLARRAKPPHVLQLCFYTEQVARIQGRMPDAMRVVTGIGETETFRPEDYLAYYRRLKERFTGALQAGLRTYPYPVEHCGICEFLPLCKEQWERDDHLTLVAGVSRLQFERLTDFGIDTLERLGEAIPATPVPKLRPSIFERLRHQASLQLDHRRTGEHKVDLLPHEENRGFALLPEHSAGDVWLDLEGHPWYEPARGLEYLFGWVYLDEDGKPTYRCEWALDRHGERAAFERLVDWLVERRRRYPGLHVYHYAAYERIALSRLMGQHATRESELDDLLRGEVLVDLYRVVRQGLRASLPSYSIKDVEKLYEFERRAEIGGGSESVSAFEEWLELEEPALLDGIRDYNADDCFSTYELHRWLLGLRPADIGWRPPPEAREVKEEAEERHQATARLRRRLLTAAEEGDPRWLLAHLLEYHRREEKPQWWEYFNHLQLDADELFHDTDTISEIDPVGDPEPDKKSLVYTLTFPAQEHKIGGEGVDPATTKSHDVHVDDERGIITLRRGAGKADEPLPQALIPPKPLHTGVQRAAVMRFAENYAAGGGRFPALVEVLERRPPLARLDGTLTEAALSLDGSYLFVQGPPGSGKTWNGARMAIALMQAGRRVGVTALSHKAIHKFLEDVRDAARGAGFQFKGAKKSGGSPETCYEDEFVETTGSNDAMLDPELQLVAGTSFLFAREEMEGAVDTLFVDEAGQFALADAIAVGAAARNLILLGDPNQLPQVSQGAHPPGTSESVLGHLLGEEETVREGMGLFLERTWRLRPEICDFISGAFYEGRLQPADVCLTRSIELGNGLRFLPVDHSGHRQASPEETDALCREVERLLGSPYVDEAGSRKLEEPDVVVVSPYNAHVRCLRERLPDGVRVGTVDKFQGQQAAVVFFSMASSSGEGPARPRLPVLAQSPERRDLEGQVSGVPGREPAPAGCQLPDGRADAARQRALPARRSGDTSRFKTPVMLTSPGCLGGKATRSAAR